MVMKTKISALIDGELDANEMRDAFISMRQDEALRQTCSTYLLIGDALRLEPHLSTEISGAVFSRLANEPVVLAPGALTKAPRPQWLRPALAMAATVAGVAVVVWLGLPVQSTKSAQPLQSLAQVRMAPNPLVVAASEDPDMQEYLIAHQIHSGSMYLNGETQHIRTVSLNGAESTQ
jgi:sigma-E factor negative regulatory protein RseA